MGKKRAGPPSFFITTASTEVLSIWLTRETVAAYRDCNVIITGRFGRKVKIGSGSTVWAWVYIDSLLGGYTLLDDMAKLLQTEKAQ